MDLILFLVLGVIAGAGVVYLLLSQKLKIKVQLDEETQLANSQLAKENKELQVLNTELKNTKSSLQASNEALRDGINDLKEQAEQSAQHMYDMQMSLAHEKLDKALKEMEQRYAKAVEDYKAEYLSTVADCAVEMTAEIESRKFSIQELTTQMDDLTALVAAGVEANKRAAEIEAQADFYKMTLPEDDLNEIKHLRSIAHYLRNPEPLNKVIWKTYYEKPCNDLIGRVVGLNPKCGIYKITNLDTKMCYVGQAVDIASRWKQHIKRGIGAETPTRNKLYPAMLALGVENFSFEIVEECSRDMLNDREYYWQEYFHAKDFGYSIK